MLEDIYNFLRHSDKLASGGMPKADQLRDAAEQGVEVVINLAPHAVPDALPNEEELVHSLGMQYINIPVIWTTPNKDGLDRFMDVMDASQDKRILVHCQANYRASGFVALYRVLRLGWKRDDALQDMKKIWSPEEYPVWDMFIEDNLPPE